MASFEIDGGDLRLKSHVLPESGYYGTPDFVLQRLKYPNAFSVETLCAAIQRDCSLAAIKSYLSSYANTDSFTEAMSETGWPALYYAVERNSADLVSILLQYKADPHWSCKTFPVPVIAFAIIHGHREALDTTDVIRTLLAFGVDPKTIPMDMWEVYLETPKPTSSSDSGSSVLSGTGFTSEYSWCTTEIRRSLASSFHLMQRYTFWMAHRMKRSNIRVRQVAESNKMSDLLKLPLFLVGQRPAVMIVQNKVFSYIAGRRNRPLVMAFDGPSGHGKTELARVMGDLLSVKIQVIDCGKVTDQWGILGPTTGWSGYEKGSLLNNFLAENTGGRSVVFLDEFDKTKQEVRDALLIAIDEGEYEDRRNNRPVDCSKTIWIIATNVGAQTIMNYYTKHLRVLSEDQIANANLKDLQKELGRVYQTAFGAPFTGRIGSIIPFIPFSEPEVAVVAYKFILKLAMRIRQPINLRSGTGGHVGHCRLTVIEDGKVCEELAQNDYNLHIGARSMENAVVLVEEAITEQYLQLDSCIEENLNEGPLQEIVVQRICIGDDKYEIKVDARMPEAKSKNEGTETVPLMEVMYSRNWQTSEKKKKDKKTKNHSMT